MEKPNVMVIVLIVAGIVAVGVVGSMAWHTMKPAEVHKSTPPPFIDPATGRPRVGGGGAAPSGQLPNASPYARPGGGAPPPGAPGGGGGAR